MLYFYLNFEVFILLVKIPHNNILTFADVYALCPYIFILWGNDLYCYYSLHYNYRILVLITAKLLCVLNQNEKNDVDEFSLFSIVACQKINYYYPVIFGLKIQHSGTFYSFVFRI